MVLSIFLACANPNNDAKQDIANAPSHSTVVVSLDRTEMVGPDGRLHGGDVVSFQQQTHTTQPLGPGEYAVAVRASATDVDGVPAQLVLKVDDLAVATLEIPPGDGLHLVSESFSLDGVGVRTLVVEFTNDLYREDADRNVMLHEVSILKNTHPTPAENATLLRSALHNTNLVLISLDTLRPDHLSAYGYPRHTSPNIDALAQAGVRFDAAISSSHWTAPAHATMLTGLHPEEHGVTDPVNPQRLSDSVTTLAEQLQQAGYQTGAFTGSYFVTELLGMNQGFNTWWEQTGDCAPATAVARSWIQEQQDPFFLFFHTYQPHAPFAPSEPFDRMFVPDGPLSPRVTGDQFRHGPADPTPEELSSLKGLYDGDIRAADACVGTLIQTLEEQDLLKDTLVIVTSDHGEEFMEHGAMGHGRLYPVLLRVPLIVSHPLLPALTVPTVDTTTGSVDLVPTILDLLGQPSLASHSGTSLVETMTGGEANHPRAYSSSGVRGQHQAVRDETGHFISNGEGLHFFKAGAAEISTIDELTAAERHDHQAQLERWQAQMTPQAPTSQANWDDDTLRALQALGYMAGE